MPRVPKLIICIFCQLICLDAISQAGWKFIKETNGIKVYFRDIPDQKIHEVKIQTTFTASLSSIVSAMRDVSAYPQWVYKVDASKKVKDLGNMEMIYYNHIDFPWPLTDRDAVIHTKISQNSKTKEVVSVSYAEPQAFAANKEWVRITTFNSKWTFSPKDKIIYGEYVFRSNPGGNIPAWLINSSLDEGPVKTIQNLKKLIKSSKYQTATESGILN